MEIMDPGFPESIEPVCEHAPQVAAAPRGDRCEECGSDNRLRACVTCGHVGCCESQAGHARAHALGEHHPLIEQVTPDGGGWFWCYEESKYLRSQG